MKLSWNDPTALRVDRRVPKRGESNDPMEIFWRTISCQKCSRSWRVRPYTEHCYCDCGNEFTVTPRKDPRGSKQWSEARRAKYEKRRREEIKKRQAETREIGG